MNFLTTRFIEIDIRDIPLRIGTRFRYTDSRMPFNGGIYEIEGYEILAHSCTPYRVWMNKLIKQNKNKEGYNFQLHENHMIRYFEEGWFTPIAPWNEHKLKMFKNNNRNFV